MWTYVRVRAEYWENDSSRYRLAMSQQTLIESLKRQTDKNFSLIICNSAMDPCYTRRLLSYDDVDVPWYIDGELDLEVPRRQIDVADDVYLSPRFIEGLRAKDPAKHIQFNTSRGFVFAQGNTKQWTSRIEHVRVQQITHGELEEESLPYQWVIPIHQMNDNMKGIAGEEVSFNCDGWRPEIISKIAETQIVTGSALGCDLYPSRSGSIIKGYKQYRNRGRVRRDEFTKSESMKDALIDYGGRSRKNRLRKGCRRPRRL